MLSIPHFSPLIVGSRARTVCNGIFAVSIVSYLCLNCALFEGRESNLPHVGGSRQACLGLGVNCVWLTPLLSLLCLKRRPPPPESTHAFHSNAQSRLINNGPQTKSE